MKFRFTQKFQKNTALVFPFFTEKKKPVSSGWPSIDRLCENQHQEGHFDGKEGEVFVRYPGSGKLPRSRYSGSGQLPSRIVFVCLGEKKKLKTAKILVHVAAALKKAKAEKGNEISIAVPMDLSRFGEALSEALVLANYNPAKYKTGAASKKIKEHDITACFLQLKKFSKSGTEHFTRQLERGRLLAEATNTVREWVNGPPNFTTPEFMEEQAVKLAKANGYKVTIFRKKDLEKMGMGGILAVNSGSSKEARLLVLEYQPESDKKSPPIVLVGKGIIFDSGGYNLKPTGYIENMHLDMAGAAAVIGIFQLLKKFKISVPVVALAPITDNAIDANATKPSTIIKMFGGKTVEITNTDAEGRLVLGDAVGYAVKTYKPRYLVDLATLTGACMVALGERYAGLFDNDKDLRKLIQKASRATDELVWPMPLHREFEEAMKGELTDLRNSEEGRYAGASKGAAFIKAFVGKTKWAHLDIAGPAYTTQPKKYETKRATGYGVRLLMKFLENLKP